MGMLRAVKCFNVAKKVTKAESTLRCQEVYGYLSKGYSRAQILQNCADWGLGDRMVDNYIQKARELLDKDCDIARPAYLAELLQRLRTYEQAAAKRGQYQVAVNSATQQARLVGLDT